MGNRVVTGKTRLCGIIGDPIEHTMSPAMHNAAFARMGLDFWYVPFRVKREELGAAIQDAGLAVMFHTFGGHPAACAAAAEVLSILVEEDLVERARIKGDLLNQQLHEAFDDHPHVAEVRGKGLLQAIEVVRTRDDLEPFEEADGISNRIVGVTAPSFLVYSSFNILSAIYLLPVAAIGHIVGLKTHTLILKNDQQFKRIIGAVLIVISVLGLSQV